MGIKLRISDFDNVLKEMKSNFKFFAPKVFEGKGRCSDTDMVRYGEISKVSEIVFDKKSAFSPKEVLLPITQTLFFYTEDKCIEPNEESYSPVIFLRSCDIHAVKRFDDIYLRNGFEDPYYKKTREKAKFILIGCEKSFDSCWCVDMGTNKTEDYNASIKVDEDFAYLDIKDEELLEFFRDVPKVEEEVKPDFVLENKVKVNIPEDLDTRIFKSDMWNEYSERCIACGRCNFVCPTCTCNTMQDIVSDDNPKVGERRRVWAGCQVQGFTTMAGGHEFRKTNGEKMRFKIMHKVYDYKKRWGYHMCVGCGRCDDICPEYISVSGCINKLEDAFNEVKKND